MSFIFSEKSLAQLVTCHKDLQLICHHVILLHDFRVLEGHRDKDAQDKAVAEGKSKTPWPTGKHNALPSLAVDLLPMLTGKFIYYPEQLPVGKLREECAQQWTYFGGLMMGVAAALLAQGEITHALRWGHDWNGNDNLFDQSFVDAPHFELVAA